MVGATHSQRSACPAALWFYRLGFRVVRERLGMRRPYGEM